MSPKKNKRDCRNCRWCNEYFEIFDRNPEKIYCDAKEDWIDYSEIQDDEEFVCVTYDSMDEYLKKIDEEIRKANEEYEKMILEGAEDSKRWVKKKDKENK